MPKKVKKTESDHPFKSVNNWMDKFYSFKNYKSSKTFWVILIIVGLLLLAIYKKSWVIAATVNGSPISNVELQQRLNDQFRKPLLDELITEKIILEEARKKSVTPTEAEIDQRIKELETQVGGAQTLDTLLSQQNQTRFSIRSQIKIQLALTKLYGNEATVSADEVDKFIAQNGSTLQSTDSAKQKEEATNLLKQQKLSQIFNQKVQDLRSKAKIQIF